MLANKKSGFAKQIRTIFIFYPIINENFSQNLQYFAYLCDITITLIKRYTLRIYCINSVPNHSPKGKRVQSSSV